VKRKIMQTIPAGNTQALALVILYGGLFALVSLSSDESKTE
jgi:hypothetical protein